MARIRGEVERQLGAATPPTDAFDPATLVRFSADLPERLSPEERARLAARAAELEPWLQGPFLLGGDLVVGGVWRIDVRWADLEAEVPADLGGRRVLDIGSNAGYDPFMFSLRGAGEILACEPFEFIEQARFLESLYRSGVDFQPIGWQDLDPKRHGTFDLVHCHGILYHEPDPTSLLARLFEMTAPGGTLLLGSMMLADPELAEFARFVPRSYYRDDSWWWVPGPLALRAMIESAGFEVERAFGKSDGPPGEFPTVSGYLRATRPTSSSTSRGQASRLFNCDRQGEWDERAEKAVSLWVEHEADWLPKAHAPLHVADFGAGNERLRPLLANALNVDHVYHPYDLHPQRQSTTRLDVSRGLPDRDFDLGICLGLLEYLPSVSDFLADLHRRCRFAITSYVTRDGPAALPHEQRLELGWANHFSRAELEAEFAAAGFRPIATTTVEQGITNLWLWAASKP
jgi:SAM-dependent methyltransferase